ncbi:MAG: CPBP family intramembrane glutamic endopeptidase [Marinicella sp.]|nr:CPBP family intramembrane metalloprotease [Xanthomonadales bacterium]
MDKKRPVFFGFIISGILAFILIAPVILTTLQNLSGNIIFETSDIHFLVTEESEDEVLATIHQSISNLRIEELVNLEVTNVENDKILSVYFKIKSNKGVQISEFIETLKSNKSLLFKSENWKSFMTDDFVKSDSLIFSQLASLLFFSIIYLKYFQHKSFTVRNSRYNLENLTKATVAICGLVLLVQIIYLIFEKLGVNFYEYDGAFRKTTDNTWILYLTTIVLMPALEELVFRGLIFKNFLLNNMFIKGFLFTSVLFASLHQWQIWHLSSEVKISQFIIMFLISMVFCWLYKKSGQLWVVIYAHALYNGTHILLIHLFG